jgi:two-component system, OmpR family, alkaline phosphatase synthesis response regulator PhoP
MNESAGKILLIEDNKETQLLIKVLLRDFYSIDVSSDLNNSVKLLAEQIYLLVLLDINLMGAKDGIKILEFIRGNEGTANLPVIIMTAYELSDDEKKYLTNNSNAFLAKPFDKELLFQSVRKSIKEYQLKHI